MLKVLAGRLGLDWPAAWVEWRTPYQHKDRKKLFRALADEIPGLVALSLRDRDDEPANTVGADLVDSHHEAFPDFHPLRWRRRYIESYLIWPSAIADATGTAEADVVAALAEHHALVVAGPAFVASDCPAALLDVRAKLILDAPGEGRKPQFGATALDVARHMPVDAIPDDIRTFIAELVSLATVPDHP